MTKKNSWHSSLTVHCKVLFPFPGEARLNKSNSLILFMARKSEELRLLSLGHFTLIFHDLWLPESKSLHLMFYP